MKTKFNKYTQSYGGRDKYFPCGKQKDRTSDCVIRAIAHALEMDYMDVMREMFALGLELGELPNTAKCYNVYLESKGFKRNSPLKTKANKKYEVRYFPTEEGKTYLIHTSGHLTTIIDRVIYDSWNCGECSAYSYYTKN